MNRTMPPITGLAEVVINVSSLPTMRSFYQNLLGFRLISEGNFEDPPRPEQPPTISFLEIQSSDTPLGKNGHPVLLALVDYRRHAAAQAKFRALKTECSTLNHLAFEIPPDTYDDHHQRLKELELSPVEVVFENMAAKAMFFRDPEGNTLELICHHSEVDAPSMR